MFAFPKSRISCQLVATSFQNEKFVKLQMKTLSGGNTFNLGRMMNFKHLTLPKEI